MGRLYRPLELVNKTAGETITPNARLMDHWSERAEGLMFKTSIPSDGAFIFQYPSVGRRGVHMLFVFHDLDVLWLESGEVTHKARLSAWTGHDAARADAFIELPAGGADGIDLGHRLEWRQSA